MNENIDANINTNFINTRRGTQRTKAETNKQNVESSVDSDGDASEADQSAKQCRRSSIKTRSHSVPPNSLKLNSHFALFTVPTKFSEAINSAEAESWKKAMIDEINSHNEYNTWTLTDLPPNRQTIKSG